MTLIVFMSRIDNPTFSCSHASFVIVIVIYYINMFQRLLHDVRLNPFKSCFIGLQRLILVFLLCFLEFYPKSGPAAFLLIEMSNARHQCIGLDAWINCEYFRILSTFASFLPVKHSCLQFPSTFSVSLVKYMKKVFFRNEIFLYTIFIALTLGNAKQMEFICTRAQTKSFPDPPVEQ